MHIFSLALWVGEIEVPPFENQWASGIESKDLPPPLTSLPHLYYGVKLVAPVPLAVSYSSFHQVVMGSTRANFTLECNSCSSLLFHITGGTGKAKVGTNTWPPKPNWQKQGVRHTVALPFALKSILRQKKNYGSSNISPMQKYSLQKIL